MVKDSCLSLSHHCCHSRKLQVRQRAQKDSSSSPYITSREVPCDTLAIPLTRIQMYLGPCVATQEFEKYCLCMAPASDSPPVAWEGEWVAACSTGVLWVLLASVSVSLSSFFEPSVNLFLLSWPGLHCALWSKGRVLRSYGPARWGETGFCRQWVLAVMISKQFPGKRPMAICSCPPYPAHHGRQVSLHCLTWGR